MPRKGKYLTVPVDINQIIQDTILLLKHSIDKRVIIKCELDDEKAIVLGDKVQLQNVLLNLALNARDAMLDGGNLIFASNKVTLEEHDLLAYPEITPGRFVVVEVRDTGIGIPPEIQNKIFEPFFTTKKQGGTGMGLASVYGCIKNHNGYIRVESEVNKGSTFKVFLPEMSTEQIDVLEREEKAREEVSITGNILVVDDEPIMIRLMKETLEDMGFNVFIETNGLDALEFFKNRHEDIDIVILDMILPNLNGKATFNKMKEIDPKVRCIITTGYTAESIHDMLDEGALGLLQKPFRVPDLMKMIREIMVD